ncbi:cubilin-like [Pomacea canaliculata]|uniref:cubilin-like n=1 Tax=Pomacea canaliculata TaxID=400727 RepID=UPI000D73A538|nr:cubilin-like [Pomacea canaliculata]
MAYFTARYKSFNDTDILRDCGGDISGDGGDVSSPNYPTNYDNLRVCEWRITVENTFSVRVEVHDLHIVSSYYCQGDALLFTGVSPTRTMGSNYRLCGQYTSYNGPPINSANNTLTMRFVSDWQNTGRGFNASWRKVCDQTMDVSSGWIESPRYPDNYYNNMNCSYFIQIPNDDPGYFITFTFHNFHLQGPDASGSCVYDYLEVLQIPYYNPGGHIVPPNAQRFCGTSPTQTLTTYFPTLLQFVTDGSITMSGFSISFEQKISECGQSVLVGERGFVASPNHPGTFPPYINCTTTIQVEAGHNITLTFQSFFLGNFLSSGNSCWGWSGGVLQIFNGPSSGSPLIGTYCGYSSPPPITSSGSALTLIFSSNHNNYATGFNATYMSSSLLHNCGDTDIRLQENSQHYLYYDYYSQRDRRCEWTITAEKGLAIMMVGYISCDDDCVNRFLKIYNGTSKNESSLITPRYRYNGEISVDEATNAIVVEYLTDNSSYYFYMSVTFMAYNSTGQNFTCGSTNVSAGEGNITFTSYTSLNIYGYHRNGICTWTIEANEDQVIQLVFRDFHIESDLHICNESSQSYLEIFDESQTSDNLLLQACYYDIPHLVTSTTRRLVVVLTLGEDFGFTRASFTARYKSFNDTDILRDCGGNMSGDEGVVSSPNFPKNYDNLRVCEWRITVENTFSVRVEVHDLHIVSYSYCVEDALLFNGVFPTLTMGSNYRLCGHNSNYNGPPINSANNTLTMRFVSDWQNTGRGFNASWRKVCDQTLDVSSGWMESPRYPDSYYNNMNCSYFIQIPNNDPGYFIAFTFHNFHLQGPDASGSCVNDYLEVLQIPYYSPGGHIVPPNAQRFCGTNPTQTLTTYFPTLLQFVTDESITMSGFSISFEQKMSECGQSVLVGERGFVVSPNHPGTFPPYINCTTTIQVEAGQNITLTFQSFFLGNFLSSGNNCWGWSGGVLQIFNGPSSGSPLIGTYCGYSSPPPITSSGSALTLIFSSNHNNYATGFNATYMSSSLLHNCGDTDIRLQENSQHYLYYNHYTQRDRRCEWTITAEKGLAIMMLGYTSCYDDDDCLNRFLKIYNGTSKNESSLITPRYRYGDISVDEATNTIVVEYLADNSSNYFYMSVTFMAYNSTVTCGSTNVSAGEGNITFTSYASPSINGYHRNGICTWTIEANEDEVIQLVFRDFHIESDLHICNESSQSYLEIFDESQTSDNLLLQAGYYDIPHLVTSTTRRLVVVLTLGEDFGFTRASFTARYKSFNDTDILRDCGGNLSGDEGVVSSPNYPTNYDNLRVCEWRITVENTFSVRVEVHDLDIVSSYRCTEDSLLFTGVTLSGYTGPNYLLCGHYDNYYLPPINSVNNTLTMRFVSDWEDTGRGFNASWRKVCDKTLDASSGWIESPRYPANYYNNMNCSYLIQISNNIPGYFITFTFHNFNLQGPDTSGSCVYDYLEVLQVPYYNPGGHIVPPNAQRFCGTSPTQTLTTYFPTLLQFVTDESITMGGFSISFEQNMADCGETLIVGERGFIASPNHPGTFPRYINCTTTIQVEAGYNITLTFQSFFLGDYLSSDNGSNCRSWSEGVLQIYDGISSSSPLIGKYCGYVSPLPITSSGSALTLIFTSHYNYYATGFNATYVSSSVSNAFRDCGGQLNGTSNEVTSPRYPDLYPDNAVCEWIINGNKGDIIRLSFVDFRLQASMSCQKDSLEVRDGNNANAPVLYRVCGDTIPQEVTSTGNTMFVRFVTDGEITDRGFKAFWKSDVPDCSRKDCPTQNGGCNKDECYCDEGYELSATSPHTCDTSELAKVTTEITVNISVPPSDLFNSSAYDRWRRRAEDVLYNQLKKTVPGLWLVNVTALRLGSLIIDTDIVVDNKSNPYAVSFLVYALAALSANSLTIGELSGTVIVRVLGKNLDADSVCEIYTSISKCPEKQLCHADNGQPMCRVPSEDHAADQSLVVGLLASLSAVLGVIVVAMGIVIMKKNKRKRTVSNQNPVANDGQYPRNAFGEPVLFARATAFNSLRNPFSGNKY